MHITEDDNVLLARVYQRPSGRVKEIELTNVYASDATYFNDHDIQISLEELTTGDIVVYACPRSDITEESEISIFAGTRNCHDTLHALRKRCEKVFV